MGLKIFKDTDAPKAPTSSFADDVVGRFRSGYQVNDRPAALTEWRVTTGDPEVAEAVRAIMGGGEAQEWAAKGEDNLEVFTTSGSVDVIVEKVADLRQRLVLWGRNGKPIYISDGETISYPDERKGEPDPDASLDLNARKQKARDGIGAEPQIEVYFRLAANPDLGIFKFQSASWSLVRDLDYNGTEDALTDAVADSNGAGALVSLALENVSFVAKNGPQAGKTVSFTKPVLTVKGAAAPF
ncbi:hypothetical protein [Cellulosimicrobium sp. TH-20]|uniref:recombination directionality factor n=1 Tax=Cellulosimicrobium sp. TH-20 TaxID=1980001 RepID=UPI00119DDF53|nr:hypothetical protein [Cellulosimicrobium sp. TH-20]